MTQAESFLADIQGGNHEAALVLRPSATRGLGPTCWTSGVTSRPLSSWRRRYRRWRKDRQAAIDAIERAHRDLGRKAEALKADLEQLGAGCEYTIEVTVDVSDHDRTFLRYVGRLIQREA